MAPVSQCRLGTILATALCTLCCGCLFGGIGDPLDFSPPPFEFPENTPPTVTGVGALWDFPGLIAVPEPGQVTLYAGMPDGAAETLGLGYEGSEVTAWSWDFAAAGNPAASTARHPNIVLGKPGTYACHVTVTNPFGSETYDFNLTLLAPGEPEPVFNGFRTLTGVETATLISGQQYSCSASELQTYDWLSYGHISERWQFGFGGGVSPATATHLSNGELHRAEVLVTAGPPGTYQGSVTATNSGGFDSAEFEYTVVTP